MCTEKILEYMVDCIYFKILLRVWQNHYSIDKPSLKTKQYVNTVTNCLYEFIIQFVFYASV